ncbi:protein-disulfide reductase DsbD family protein [Marseilla massiliensis]|uniref:Thioredoxin family protein n=1 Tax=Marseilla massiliensis TaxID=1841864 RepID=A0A939B7V3_9BACT|nr:thioredoxin family protein [Marseilla massiliensis]MBM6674201.1 thioredoxin family protein [Marseilla massiliensis]
MKKQIFITMLLAVIAIAASAQMQDPVHFSVSQKKVAPDEIEVTFSGKIDAGWHVYSTALPADGPISATITTEKNEGAAPKGSLGHRGKEINQYDNMFGMNLRFFENSVTFYQRYKLTGKTYHVKGYLEYGSCNDEMCMPPTQVEFDFKGEGPADAPATEEKKELPAADTVAVADTTKADTAAVAPQATADTTGLWTPVIDELRAFDGAQSNTDHSWVYIFFMGFVGGLVALFTPCVWPIIPMTVSFFLKRAKDKKKGIRDAMTYGVSIIVIYLALGLAITAIFGASSLNALATNAVFNIFFFLLLVVFALSFFGWFELTLPSSWTNKVDNKASSTSGLLSIFLMAFTLTLVSFSCTGPIIGFLLVEVSTSGSITGPAIGMLGFAVALALPFTLFAMFPTWLKQAPKSGSWMNIIKVTLGFIELAFALKFFSVADLAYGWGLLDREVFLSLWIVIFGLLGLYLIGKLKFRSDGDDNRAMPVPCIVLGMLSLAFTVYMIPGLWGAPCKAVSAFAPPMNTQDFNLYNNEVHPRFKDYEQGMAAAKAEGKPVLIDFTGFGCVNCRKMEAAVWTDPQVADKLNNDFVLISLYVDDKQPLDHPIEIVENGKKRTLRTIGDKWSYLQRSKFGANAQPFYVIIDNEGKPLTGSYSYDEDISHYLEFMNKGLENYRK